MAGSADVGRPLLAALAILLATTARPATAQPSSDQPVYVPPGVENLGGDGRFESVITLRDGRIFNWYVIGKNHSNPGDIENPNIPQKAYGRFSEDGGRTWSEPFLMFEFPREKGARLGGVALYDRSGVLHLFGLNYFRCDVKTADPAKSRCDLWHAMSPDLGKTWSPVQRIDFQHTYTGATNSVIQLKSGRILVPLEFFSSRTTGKFITTCVYSDDGGRTWRKSRSDIVVDSGHRDIESGACEPVAVELKDGRIWMLIRTQTGYEYESFSSDGGETWSEPVQSRFISTNSPVQLLRLHDGRIVIVWNNCTFGNLKDFRGDRAVLNAAISADDGKTWQGYREVARLNVSGVVCYPFMCETPDGKVLLRAGGALLLRFAPDWLTETSLTDDFSEGLAAWATMGTEGVTVAEHPDRPGRKVLSLRKTNPEKAAAAVRNFPFGSKGRLTLRLKVNPGFKGARLCLTDFFSLPPIERKGRFGVYLAPNGWMHVMQGDGEDMRAAYNPPGKWFTLSFLWDCSKKRCDLLVNGKKVAVLWQLLAPDLAIYPPNLADGQRVPEAYGLCYLRIWSTAEGADEAGLMVESLRVRVAP